MWQTSTESYYFFRGLGFSLYIIIGLITFIYFAFRYYTHNPFRHFYPLAPSYFWKIFAQLFTLLFVYASVFISYENGLLLKAKKITPVETMVQEIHQVNLAYPFLFNNLRSYHIENRVYPKPFPLDDVSSFVIGHDSINDVDIKHELITTNLIYILMAMNINLVRSRARKLIPVPQQNISIPL